ncbi:MAG: SRPBCC family protein [Rhodobacter sp.]|nr:SRPBCC family protein [Paracoccaceae bacterium]MCC0077026.1 SRPBCC family protein [Rhodobacter sp.]
MDIELARAFDATPEAMWAILLDPQPMAECVPGMEAVEVVSPTEYLATIKVKIAFISARFKVRTVIAQADAPRYLRCEVTGEDSAVGSAIKAVAEMWLTPTEAGTELRVKGAATIMGRLGALGLNPVKTKAERMWEDFCVRLAAKLAGPADVEATPVVPFTAEPAPAAPILAPPIVTPAAVTPAADSVTHIPPRKPGFLARLLPRSEPGEIRVELERDGTRAVLHWPAAQGAECLAWLERTFAPTR